MTDWYTLEAPDAVRQINSDLETGLSAAEAERRLAEYGSNELVERGGRGPWTILLEQFTGIMVVMLIISAVVSAFLGEWIDALVIMIIVVLNAVLGFVQEYRAEQAMAALKRMAVPHVRVRRDGHLQEVTARELVPGDIIQLETGNTVPRCPFAGSCQFAGPGGRTDRRIRSHRKGSGSTGRRKPGAG